MTPQDSNSSQNAASTKKTALIVGAVGVLIIAAVIAWVLVARHNDQTASQTDKDHPPYQTDGQRKNANKSGANGDQKAGTPSSGSDNQSAQTGSSSSQNIVSAISIKDMAFSPASATVKKGAPLTWTNNDSMPHAIAMADSSQTGPHSPQLKTGESYTYTFSKTGTYKYICAIHPSMTATITVVE